MQRFLIKHKKCEDVTEMKSKYEDATKTQNMN